MLQTLDYQFSSHLPLYMHGSHFGELRDIKVVMNILVPSINKVWLQCNFHEIHHYMLSSIQVVH